MADHRVVEVLANALELRAPGAQRIRLIDFDHVPHRQRQLVEIVLNTEQLQRFAPAGVAELGLEAAEAGDLAGNVPGIRQHHGEGDQQPTNQRRRG